MVNSLNWEHKKTDKLDPATLNRIEGTMEQLRVFLKGHGYQCAVEKRTEPWTRESYLSLGEVNRLRRNVEALQEGFAALPQWRAMVYEGFWDNGQQNALEWDLHLIDVWAQRMAQGLYFYSGQIQTGVV